MKYSLKFTDNGSTCGAQLIMMVKSLMYFFKHAETALPPNVSSNDLLRNHGNEPRKIVTDKLKSYGVAHRELIPESIHDTSQYANNRAELSHQPTRVRERGMRRFKSTQQAQRFLGVHAAVHNLFNLGRHLVSAKHYRLFRECAFSSWKCVTAL